MVALLYHLHRTNILGVSTMNNFSKSLRRVSKSYGRGWWSEVRGWWWKDGGEGDGGGGGARQAGGEVDGVDSRKK